MAREENMESEYFRYDMHKVLPIINQEGSDSAMLDNALEFMMMSGMDLPLSVMVTIPAPWEHDKSMPQEIKDFYRYYATMMEPGMARLLSCSVTAIWLERFWTAMAFVHPDTTLLMMIR